MFVVELYKCLRPGIRQLQFRRHKVLTPCLSRSALERNSFRFIAPIAAMATSSSSSGPEFKKNVINKSLTHIENKKSTANANRTLVLFFSWMLAKGKHQEKFVKFYNNHGYDLLIVNTLPFQLFLPGIGAVKNAENILKFLDNNNTKYSNVIVHGFSVGAYAFGEVLALLSKDKQLSAKLSPLFRAVIMDSAANLAAIPIGFSKALSSNPVLQPMLRAFIAFYLRCFWPVATKYYAASEKEYCEMNHIQVPSLLLISEADPVGNIPDNQFVADCWIKRGIPVKIKVWKDSKHVDHYRKHPEEYERELREIIAKTMPK